MELSVKSEIARLADMTVGQMKQKYAELFGEQTRSSNRQWLFRRIAWRIQSLAEGDLSNRARARARELAQDVDLRVRPPREFSSGRESNAPVVTRRIDVNWDERLPMPGAVLKRMYKGKQFIVNVLEKGFEYDGQVYRSLSAVAHEITGSHWNGYLFFGLKEK